jgi:hypothetical protein
MDLKIKVSLDRNKIQGNHHLKMLKSFRKNLRKGSVVEGRLLKAKNYQPEHFEINGVKFPKKYFK